MANLSIGIVAASTFPPDLIADLNPLVYYKFDEGVGSSTIIDYGSLGYDLSSFNMTFGVTPVRPASTSTGATFNGTTSYAIGSLGSILSGGDAIIGVWVKNRETATGSGFGNIAGQFDGSGGGQSGWTLSTFNNGRSLVFNSYNTSGGFDADPNTVGSMVTELNGNKPIFVLVKRSGTTNQIWINGALMGTDTGTGTTWTSGHNLRVGVDHAASSFFDGDMDALFILDSATLDQYDIWRLYDDGAWTGLNSRPANDNWANADVWDPDGDFVVDYDITYASLEEDEVGLTNVQYTPRAVWASFTPALSGPYNFSIVGGAVRNNISYFTGTALDNLVYVNKLGGAVAPFFQADYTGTATLTAGTTYYFRIGAWSIDEGSVEITVTPPPPLQANDNWANAITIDTTTSGSQSGNYISSTMESGEPQTSVNAQFGSTFGTNTVWYKFTADATGTIVFTNSTHTTDPVVCGIDVYHGAAVNALTLDGGGVNVLHDGTHYDSTCTVSVTNGTTYYVQIAPVGSTGAYQFQWTDIT